MHGRPDFILHQRLQRGIALGRADAELEEAVVDGADFDRYGQTILLHVCLAKTGHAL